MSKPGYHVFQPANDDPKDEAMRIGAPYVQQAFFPKKSQHYKDRAEFSHLNSMAALSSVDPAVLIVFGHGNMGAGIGTHKTYYDEDALVRKLSTGGLKQQQKNLTLYLWACNTGAHTPGSGLFSRMQEPFAKRFANKLHEYGFRGIRVIGVAGFIAGNGAFTSLKYNGKPIKEVPSIQPTDVSRHLMFDVGNSVVSVNENKWKCEKASGNQGWIVKQA
ncbi:MAG: hypothetical protein KUG73_05305 [Pseudomonadales bacterium]|nr:hypothetical protein [Pseudomonadales bacterium]